ncbi:MAG: hypothetical protein CML66_28160 [Rhodobacteraceae bacterium]|nr:hypothetical protein [Paracoccaceae bacterium]MAY47704.1 hypothetical protein [Paracoccaceae bacterium]
MTTGATAAGLDEVPGTGRGTRRWRWLVCTHHLHFWAGSEVVTLELIRGLVERGHAVTLYSRFADRGLLEAVGLERLPRIAKPEDVRVEEYDVIYSHHQTPTAFLASQTPEALLGENRPVFVYNHLSPFEPFEFPGPFSEAVLADILLANSPETRAKLAEYGPAFNGATLFPNPAPRAFAAPQPELDPTWLTRVLSVSNHLPEELAHAFRILQGQGVQVTRIGTEGEKRKVTPADVQTHDAVVSIGKTVQYAIRAHRPVFCYDHFGGPGWLMPDKVRPAAETNFSGRCTPGKRSAEVLARELAQGFAAAARQLPDSMPYRLEDHLDQLDARILKLRAGRPVPQVDPAAFLALCAREKALYGLIDRQYAHARGIEEKCRVQAEQLRAYEETLGQLARSPGP